jgi:hypothetical protein
MPRHLKTSTGKVYVNFMAEEGAKRIMDAYSPETLA